MILADFWDPIWRDLRVQFDRLGKIARSCNPDVYWHADHWHTDHFPFRAHVYFSRSHERREEDFTMSANCWSGPSFLQITADVARNSAEVIESLDLIEVPRVATSVQAELNAAFRKVHHFFDPQADVMKQELC